ncbi:MAG: SPFH domain-containing protein [Clostridia bacterium]|nr:SPFH domain-containing protein [Clostridia bacterium]MBR3130848.1 SPFH domain-containing protein [Clostridia bacterium]
MGLIKAGIGALGGVLADQWKEFFYCEALTKDVLVTKGQKRTGSRTSNTKGSDNIISNGSVIAVADGQCMIIVEQGKVVEVCAEPGEFVYDTSTEPSIFAGNLGQSILDSFKTLGRRFTFGGDTGKDQRVYYFNTKEIMDNKFGTSSPIMFRVVDRNINLDIDVNLRCNGVYSYKMVDPILFYTEVCGNVTQDYLRSEIDSQLKTEFVNALQPAMAKISDLQVRPNQVPAHTTELCEAMNVELSKLWGEKRGLKVVSIAMNPITLTEEDAELIKSAQRAAINRDPNMAAATMTQGTVDAMKTAAGNANGAMTGFMGMGMTGMAGGAMGNSAANLFTIAQQQKAAQAAPAAPADGWTCPKCGAVAQGNFCPECGTKKPEAPAGWTCPKCGAVNTGKFCTQCGAKKPEAVNYRCSKCGFKPEDPANPPKFCPECGNRFEEKDIVE